LVGGGIGLALGSMIVGAGDPTGGFLPVFYLPTKDLVRGVIFVFLLGLVAGIVPAVQAMRLRIVDALRRG
jgi:putative ABC transport system permease protein